MININKNERKELKKKIDMMNGYEFEEYLYYLFISLGYEVKTTPLSIDYGADLIIAKDGVKTVVQAKRYNTPVGVGAIQEVLGAKGYYDADLSLVVTNNIFTNNSKLLAKKNKVKLWDRNVLSQYLVSEEEINLTETKERKIEKKKEKRARKNKSFNQNIDIIIGAITKSKS